MLMLSVLRVFLRNLRSLPRLLLGIFAGWPKAVADLARTIIRRICYLERLKKLKHPQHCAVLPPDVYKRPDPMIYSQEYLLAQNLAVTWDNPDIQLFQGGIPVSSNELLPDTDYLIVARIWNGSTEAPAVDLPVDFSFMSFGIGAQTVKLGRTLVTLPVNGAAGHPASAQLLWHTPATPGHYCIVVDLVWPDDANPANNRGQENTNVGKLNSPRAEFAFPLRNARPAPRTIRLEADAYELATPPSCEDRPPANETKMSEDERNVHIREARRRAGRGAFPVPPGWTVTIEPPSVQLAAGESRNIKVEVLAPDGFTGRKSFNVNALAGATLAGGVTLVVEGS
jgi:hypothetical protein